MNGFRPILILLFTLFFAGCSTYEVMAPKPGEDGWAPTVAKYGKNGDTGQDGSLYQPNYMFTLFQDRRAYRTGDILTVTLEESTQSSKKANTSTEKSSELDIPTPTIGSKSHASLGASISGDNTFKGTSSSSQQNTLSGYITVTVADVLPNGVLHIRGEKWIRLNQGDEYIRLDGLVRVEDIDLANRISSQRLANAHIAYAGRGALADANQAGWLSRFFNSSLAPL